jgi:2-keto-3-deoxygluconate permease
MAAADSAFIPVVAVATAQIAASCIITAFLCPAIVVFMYNYLKKRESSQLNPKKFVRIIPEDGKK